MSFAWLAAPRLPLTLSQRFGCALAVLIGAAQLTAQPLPPGMTSVTPTGGDDTGRIQYAIDNASGGVFFRAGVYRLSRPLILRSGLTYAGEGGFTTPYGSILKQTGVAAPGAPGNAIFRVQGVISSVTITRLTFSADAAVMARGIAAANSSSLLRNSSLRENNFLTELAECIDTPMIGTRIERNEFGQNGSSIGRRHRHIRSVNPTPAQYAGVNWVTGNVFRSACCETAPAPGETTESVYFDSSVPLRVIGNNFETNDTETVLRIHGVSQVVIEGNWFEGNHGFTQMTFLGPASYSVQLQNNWYSMYGRQRGIGGGFVKIDCDPNAGLGNCYVFRTSPGLNGGGLPLVYMGYEAGQNFTAATELTPNPNRLVVTAPLCLRTYRGAQAGSFLLDCR